LQRINLSGSIGCNKGEERAGLRREGEKGKWRKPEKYPEKSTKWFAFELLRARNCQGSFSRRDGGGRNKYPTSKRNERSRVALGGKEKGKGEQSKLIKRKKAGDLAEQK